MRLYIVIIIFALLTGCGFSDYQDKVRSRENNAIMAVKKAPGSTAKSIQENIGLVLAIAEGAGHKVTVIGWGAETVLKSDDVKVRFQVKDNEFIEEFRWIVDKNGGVLADNELASKVTKK